MTMKPNIVEGEWYVVDGPQGGETVPADVVHYSDEELANARAWRMLPADSRRDFFQNGYGEVWSIEKKHGWGAQLHMPGYMDQTDWSFYETEEAAKRGILEEHGVCPECEADEQDDAKSGCLFCNPDTELAYCPHEACVERFVHVAMRDVASHAAWHREQGHAVDEAAFTRYVENPRKGVRTRVDCAYLIATALDGRLLASNCETCEACPHDDVATTWVDAAPCGEPAPTERGGTAFEARGECQNEACGSVMLGHEVRFGDGSTATVWEAAVCAHEAKLARAQEA